MSNLHWHLFYTRQRSRSVIIGDNSYQNLNPITELCIRGHMAHMDHNKDCWCFLKSTIVFNKDYTIYYNVSIYESFPLPLLYLEKCSTSLRIFTEILYLYDFGLDTNQRKTLQQNNPILMARASTKAAYSPRTTKSHTENQIINNQYPRTIKNGGCERT